MRLVDQVPSTVIAEALHRATKSTILVHFCAAASGAAQVTSLHLISVQV